jgi:hypothetical protein
MDEDETTEEANPYMPKRHDRWSVLAIGLQWATDVAGATTAMFGNFATAAVQHHHQNRYDGRFKEMTWEHR